MITAQITEMAKRFMVEQYGPCPSDHETLIRERDRWDEKFGLVILAIEFTELNKVKQPDEFGCYKHIAQWLESKTYRMLMHRHTGTFVATDESENGTIEADTLPLLSDALLNWPNGAKLIPLQKWVKVNAEVTCPKCGNYAAGHLPKEE